MSDQECSHCEHLINTIHTDFSTSMQYVCCQCGKERTKIIPNKGGSILYKFDKSEHGPFLPDYKVRF